MQNILEFDITRKNKISDSFRVSKILGQFDLKLEHSDEHFIGKIEMPEKWNIGAIIGPSGTGKSTIGTELFGDKITKNNYTHDSVIDDMPENCTIEEIGKMFYAVGFGSTPSWLKPYKVLSNGEKMRVDLANAMLKSDFCVFDEFTSVVDRNVAQTMCIATNKFVKKHDKHFIAISCHYDILDWLQPDWYYDTGQMKCFFGTSHALKNNLKSESVAKRNGKCLGNIII
jgi:Fe-S cluster assembly ATPase SufC